MKVLFLYPNVARARSPQVGLSSLAGTLLREGHEARIFDITFMEDAEIPEAWRKILRDYEPDLIGVSCRSTEWETAQEILGMAEIDVPVVVGGPHATIAPEEVIADERVDMLVRGEGEEAVIDLLDRMENGGGLTDMPNLWIKQNGDIHKNDVRPLIQDLDSIAFPEWRIWDWRHFQEHYHHYFSPDAEIFGDLETSRGCPYACPYCLTPVMQKIYRGKGKYHREKSAQRIIAEIKKLQSEMPVDYIRFVDETFILNKKRLKEFCSLYEGINLPFSFSTRPETVNDEIMRQLARAGANCMSFGLESGNEAYRRDMLNRRTSQAQVINAVAVAKRHGVKTFAFVMIGLPDEDREKIQDTIDLIHVLQPDVFQVTIFYPFRGTPFYDYCLEQGYINQDHKRLTEIWKGSVLNQQELPSDYLVRKRELMLAFAKADKHWWPLMRFLEWPPAFRVWQTWMRGERLAIRFMNKLARLSGREYGKLQKTSERLAPPHEQPKPTS